MKDAKHIVRNAERGLKHVCDKTMNSDWRGEIEDLQEGSKVNGISGPHYTYCGCTHTLDLATRCCSTGNKKLENGFHSGVLNILPVVDESHA